MRPTVRILTLAFAASGRVVRGMDVVRRIQACPAEGQALAPPVTILSARVVKG